MAEKESKKRAVTDDDKKQQLIREVKSLQPTHRSQVDRRTRDSVSLDQVLDAINRIL